MITEDINLLIDGQREILERFVDKSLRNSSPEDLYHQKAILIAVVVTAAIIGILTVATVVILISIVVEQLTLKLRKRRQRNRYDLIPTYHNVRALRSVEPNLNYSYESIDIPPPPIPVSYTHLRAHGD